MHPGTYQPSQRLSLRPVILGGAAGIAVFCLACLACSIFLLVYSPSIHTPTVIAEAETIPPETSEPTIIHKPSLTPRPTATPKPSPVPRPTATPTPRTTYAIGDTVAHGNWEYRVAKVERAKTLIWSKYGSKTDAKGLFLIVYLTLRNIGKENFSIHDWDFELHDESGIRYNPSNAFGIFSFVEYKGLIRLGEQFPPGVPLNTALIFDINPDAKGLLLYLEQARVSIDLAQ